MQPAHNSLALCGLFTALMAVGALIHITVPIGIWQVTLSLQIFVAVLAGFFLGPRQGFLSILAYLVLGLAGAASLCPWRRVGVPAETYLRFSAGVSLCRLAHRKTGGETVRFPGDETALGSCSRR